MQTVRDKFSRTFKLLVLKIQGEKVFLLFLLTALYKQVEFYSFAGKIETCLKSIVALAAFSTAVLSLSLCLDSSVDSGSKGKSHI